MLLSLFVLILFRQFISHHAEAQLPQGGTACTVIVPKAWSGLPVKGVIRGFQRHCSVSSTYTMYANNAISLTCTLHTLRL